ncbi:MAG: 3TM-type holin, partial [Thermoanaerobaculia bacterium]
GWVCAAALAVMLVLGPMLEWGSAVAGHPMKAPVMPTETVMALVTSMLGIAGMRTYEKLKDVSDKH